ncbi:unnamed protein product [Ilex paraguariensis]|uniref:Uncharacterized protein n=1 Tax=Ilex paraguariensis TaxID=185542 RepID=A0ABC8RMU6_9AQUA
MNICVLNEELINSVLNGSSGLNSAASAMPRYNLAEASDLFAQTSRDFTNPSPPSEQKGRFSQDYNQVISSYTIERWNEIVIATPLIWTKSTIFEAKADARASRLVHSKLVPTLCVVFNFQVLPGLYGSSMHSATYE